MKGFSLPSISIPKVSIPNISGKIDSGTLKSAITSAIPDLSSITNGLNLESTASGMLSEAMNGGIDIPPELSNLLK